MKISVKVTRKWIKDLRKAGLSNKAIIQEGMGQALDPNTSLDMSDKIIMDLQLAGLIADDD